MTKPKPNPSTSISVKGIVGDIAIIAKLILFAIYSSLQVLVKNLFIPRHLLEKAMDNQVVVVTGAAGGIGRHLVRNLLDRGCRVACLDKSGESLERLETWLGKAERSARTIFYKMDVTSTTEIKQAAEFVRRELGHVDVLVNNAGIFNKGKMFVELSEQEMRNIFEINILAQMFMCRQFLPDMLQRNRGHIVNMCSSLGHFGAFRCSDYCASKFAVAGFTEALRIEMKSINAAIKVSLVSPFHVNTDFFKGFEMNSFQWTSVCKNDPVKVAEAIAHGIVQDKELIGYPTLQSFLTLAIKNLLTTSAADSMMLWMGFNEAIVKSNQTFQSENISQ